ncbi:alpha/beta fold hydrolase [Paraflavitalea speifideaquila]|uniref:alpha/beta fold hydrolase n=1 Tax=Paraflavitalea speifideaquila TaxID=3076558 RepID=UPI0028EADEB9|nr:alpha/beta fold hydrolase [Paraflavitalea speifideiaquila]
MKYFQYNQPFPLENGQTLPELTIAYHTYGTLRADSKVVWICHALTANSEVADWWQGVVGKDCVINPDQYFIVCANILGSCYGTTGPLSTNSITNQPYFHQFPLVTIRDMVKAHILLRQYLGINNIYLLMGGSMGGYQVLEWSVQEKDLIQRLFLLATSPTESAWGIAIHATQRLAIEADSTWQDASPRQVRKALKQPAPLACLPTAIMASWYKNKPTPIPKNSTITAQPPISITRAINSSNGSTPTAIGHSPKPWTPIIWAGAAEAMWN